MNFTSSNFSLYPLLYYHSKLIKVMLVVLLTHCLTLHSTLPSAKKFIWFSLIKIFYKNLRFICTNVSWSMALLTGLSSRVRSSNGNLAISCTPSGPPQDPAAVAALIDSIPPICRNAAPSVSFRASMQKVRSPVVACKWAAHLDTWSRNWRTRDSRVWRAASIRRALRARRRFIRPWTWSSTSCSKERHSS